MPFTFKQFHIDDSNCGMPVSTDGVILGAWAKVEKASKILDIGAGSGLLSLMAAQRSQAQIEAVEIDSAAANACKQNFAASPWAKRLQVHGCSIAAYSAEFSLSKASKFDHILCNPPYFATGPLSSCNSRATARHHQSLDFNALIQYICQLLAPTGKASLIVPMQSLEQLQQVIDTSALTISEIIAVSSVVGKPAQRLLLQLNHQAQQGLQQVIRSKLTIRDQQQQYTEEMRALTQDFYLAL